MFFDQQRGLECISCKICSTDAENTVVYVAGVAVSVSLYRYSFLIILDSTSFFSEKSDSSLSFQCTPEEDRRVNWAKYCDKNKSNSNNNFNSRILGILMPLLSQITMFVTEMIQSFTVNRKGAYLG